MILRRDPVAELDIEIQKDVSGTQLHSQRCANHGDTRIGTGDPANVVHHSRARALSQQQTATLVGEGERGGGEDQADQNRRSRIEP